MYWHFLEESNLTAPPYCLYASGLEGPCRGQEAKCLFDESFFNRRSGGQFEFVIDRNGRSRVDALLKKSAIKSAKLVVRIH